jgi:hypothetical protein
MQRAVSEKLVPWINLFVFLLDSHRPAAQDAAGAGAGTQVVAIQKVTHNSIVGYPRTHPARTGKDD